MVTVSVGIATNLPPAEQATLQKQIRTDMEVRLRSSGVQVQEAGAYLRDVTGANGKALEKTGVLFASVSLIRNQATPGGVFHIHLGLHQEARLVNQPTFRITAQTWEREGGLVRTGAEESASARLRSAITDLVGEFLNDLLAASSKAP